MPIKPSYDELLQRNIDLERQNKELKKFKASFQAADDGMALVSLDGRFLDANTKLCSILGYTHKKLLQMQTTDLPPTRLHTDFKQNISHLKERETFLSETIYHHKNGSAISLELQSSILQLNGESMIQIVARNITKRKFAEKKEQLERERFNNVLQAIPDSVYIVDQQYNIEYVNPVIERAFGPVKRKKCFQYLHNRKKPCVDCNNKKIFAGEALQRDWYSTNKNKHYEVFESPLKSAHDNFVKVTFFHDVTKEKRVAKALEKSRQLLNGIVDNSSAVIYVKDTNGKYLLVNSRFKKLLNKSDHDITGKTDFDLFPESEARLSQSHDQVVLESKLVSQFEESKRHKDGKHVYLSTKFPLFDAEDSVYAVAGISTDITNYKQLERNLQENNIALRVLLKQQETVAKEVEQRVLVQLEKTVFPYISLLHQSQLDANGQEYLNILTRNLHEAGTAFIKNLSSPDLGLTKREILVADLVRQGKNTKEIAKLLKLQPSSVEAYRNKIRKKLHITNKKVMLHQYLKLMFTSKE